MSSHPRVAIDSSGLVLTTWLSSYVGQASRLVLAEELATGGFAYHTPAAAHDERVLNARLDTGGGHRAALVWQAFGPWESGGESHNLIRASVRTHSGSWTLLGMAGAALSFNQPAYDPDVAVGPEGEVVLVFSQIAGERHGVPVIRLHEGELHAPKSLQDLVSPPILFTNEPKVVTNVHGDTLVSWYQSVGASLNVFVSEGNSRTGGFSRPGSDEQLSLDHPGAEGLDGMFLDDSRPAISDQGERAVVWIQPTELGESGVFLATRKPAEEWLRPSSFDEVLTKPGIITRCPKIAFSRHGDLFLTWLEVSADGAMRAQLAHRDVRGNWLATGREPFRLSGSGFASCPEIATGRDGGVVASWIEKSLDGTDRVYVRRSSDEHVSPSESARWGRATPLNTPAFGVPLNSVSVAVGGDDDRIAVAWTRAGRLELATYD